MKNNELKNACIKIRTWHYSYEIIKIKDFDFDNILLDEKTYENIFIYSISFKTLIGAKPLHIRFNKVDGFMRIYDRTRYLVLFDPGKYDAIYSRTRYFIS